MSALAVKSCFCCPQMGNKHQLCVKCEVALAAVNARAISVKIRSLQLSKSHV